MIYLLPVSFVEGSPAPTSLFSSGRARERFAKSLLFNAFRTLVYPEPRRASLLHSQSEAHPSFFQSLPHSFAKTPGWHQERTARSSSFTLSATSPQQTAA